MDTREIPRSEWKVFFDRFSRRHEGWCVTIEIFGVEIGDQTEAREVALQGITADLSGTSDKIEIVIGAKPDDHLSHTVSKPTQVSMETDEHGDEALAIKAADETTTLLRFRSATLPETADAVAG